LELTHITHANENCACRSKTFISPSPKGVPRDFEYWLCRGGATSIIPRVFKEKLLPSVVFKPIPVREVFTTRRLYGPITGFGISARH
jgi:hypothetical protein